MHHWSDWFHLLNLLLHYLTLLEHKIKQIIEKKMNIAPHLWWRNEYYSTVQHSDLKVIYCSVFEFGIISLCFGHLNTKFIHTYTKYYEWPARGKGRVIFDRIETLFFASTFSMLSSVLLPLSTPPIRSIWPLGIKTLALQDLKKTMMKDDLHLSVQQIYIYCLFYLLFFR